MTLSAVMLPIKVMPKKITIEDLAEMVSAGFSTIEDRFKAIDHRFEKIEDILQEHSATFERMELRLQQAAWQIDYDRLEIRVSTLEKHTGLLA